MAEGLVSIIIPVYNSEKYLAEAIQSVLDQTWAFKELIIVDDGSTDGSLAIARQFLGDNVTIISQKNNGAASARNVGLKNAKGNFIQFLDADDLLSVDKIEKQMLSISTSSEKISLSNSVHFLENSNPIHAKASATEIELFKSSSNPLDFLLNLYGRMGNGGIVPIHAWLTPKALIDKVGNWNESLSFDDDGEFFCRVVFAAKEITFIESITAYYRKYKTHTSLSSQNTTKALESAYQTLLLKENHFSNLTTKDFYAKTFATSYYKLGVQSYPLDKKLSKICINKARGLNSLYNKKYLYLGGSIANYIGNHISWKFVRITQFLKKNLI